MERNLSEKLDTAKPNVSPPGCATSRLRPVTPVRQKQQNLVARATSPEYYIYRVSL